MNNIRISVLFISLVILCIAESCATHDRNSFKVLILSGRNNHEWQKTTPQLVSIFNSSGLIVPFVTEQPDTLTYEDLKKFRVLVSNWNSFPHDTFRMSKQWENDFLRYVNEGGGIVSFHAGATSFYDWDEYHSIGIGRWGKNTSHGAPARGKILDLDDKNPITNGLQSFLIVDELWENTDIHPSATVIGSLSSTDIKDAHTIEEPAIFVNKKGKGRVFYTILGHDERSLLNSGLQALLIRACQWCAGREVTYEPVQELKLNSETGEYRWNESDTSLALMNKDKAVWQLNFRNRYGKPYFHPVTTDNINLTCVSPPDHPWHLGLWFSWKYIDGVNYWEFLDEYKSPETGFRSEGITEIENIQITTNPDFSAKIRMKINYHPSGNANVLAEERTTSVSAPSTNGSYYIDEEYIFTTAADSVVLDRTPLTGEPEGQSWGGYAGLSVRLSQDFTAPEVIIPSDSAPCTDCPWLYMGFNSLTGKKAGMAILIDTTLSTPSTSWYVISDPSIPFWYYSPAVLFKNKIILKKGEKLHLKYRIWALPGETSKDNLSSRSEEFMIKQ